MSAYQHGVIDKLLFGSDFPYTSATECIEALYSINQIAQGTNLPVVPREALRGIVERDTLAAGFTLGKDFVNIAALAAHCRGVVLLAFIALAGCSIVGCAGSKPQLTLTSIDHHNTWRQQFSSAYSRRDANGNLDIVLVDRPSEQALAGRHPTLPVRQVMYIHVLWTPARDQSRHL